MNTTILLVIITILIASSLCLGWRSYVLNRRIQALTESIHRAVNEKIPQDVPGLEELSNAIVTLQTRLQQQIEAATAEHSRLATVLEQIPDGIMISNADNQIQLANPAAAHFLDKEAGTLVGSTVNEALRHHELIEIWQSCQKSRAMQSEVIELPLQQRFLQIVAIPDQYAPDGILLLIQDLTRLRRLETVRRDFISNLSHELRTPLASLKALTETLQNGALDDPPAARRFLGSIETEVDALTQMVQGLLDLARIESGQVTLELQQTKPLRLLQSAVERMHLQAERAGIKIMLNCPAELPSVQVDTARIEQVVVNLIHNAIKFTEPGGSVALSASPGHGQVRFTVQDTGAGIPASDLPRIFERFYKADRARSSHGTGLGLSISKHLIEVHQGKIWAESIEGRGSTFCFSLPILQEKK